jgi:SAM-dependent methyltransferase
MPEWFEEWFGEEYLEMYPHRDDADADRAVALVLGTVPFQPGWRVLDVACGPGRHARAFRAAGARCVGVDLSAALLRVAQRVTDAPLVRGDMWYLPIRTRSMSLTVNLFTSFGYFDRDEEHESTLAEMVRTVEPGGWFVVDLLNPAAVRAGLVPSERISVRGSETLVTRSITPDNRYVRKTIQRADGRMFVERVRLFEPDEIGDMLVRTGVEVRHRFGGYDGHILRTSSARTILIGQAA